MHLDAWKKELGDNIEFKETFPPIQIVQDAEGDSTFQHQDGFQTKVLCKGVEQLGSIRGVKFRAYRPDLIIIDDLEDDELVRSVERRVELQEQFDEVLDKVGEKYTQFVMVGTVLHDDSQLAKMLSADKYLEFHKITLQAHLKPDTQQESSLWPEKWTVADLKKLRQDKPNVYAKEMQNDPVAGVNQKFSKDIFRYWKIEGDKYILLNRDGTMESCGLLRDCKAGISCDLAWKEKRSNDFSCLMGGILTPNSEILVEGYLLKKGMKPDETANNLFVMVERLEKITGSNVPVGFEKSMLENVTQWLLKQEMKKRNKFIITKELIWDADKNTRIETRLQPRYAQGVIYHKHGMGELEFQLTRFPTGTFDDAVDTLQGLVQVLQNPKKMSVETPKVDQFEAIRQYAIKGKQKERFLGFGKKHKLTGIIARRAII